MKEVIRFLLGVVLYPVRCSYRRRNGVGHPTLEREIPNDILLGMVKESVKEGHDAIIRVKGFSMRPFLEHQRDKVVLGPVGELHDYDAVLAEITPGHYVLHRIIRLDGDNVTLMGDGNVRGTESCKVKDVVAIVKQYVRPSRCLSADDKTLNRRIRIWRRLLPVRRYLLFIYKTCI